MALNSASKVPAAGGRMPEGALGPRSAKIAGWKVHVRGAPWGYPRQRFQGSSSSLLEKLRNRVRGRDIGMDLIEELPHIGLDRINQFTITVCRHPSGTGKLCALCQNGYNGMMKMSHEDDGSVFVRSDASSCASVPSMSATRSDALCNLSLIHI